MVAVIFEVAPNPGRRNDHLEIAAYLKPLLVDAHGFISIERFQSLADPDKLLSLSFWTDEAACTTRRGAEERARAYRSTLTMRPSYASVSR